MPAAPRPPLCPPSKGHTALFAFQPHCWLPGTVAVPPAPRLGTLVSSGLSPAACIFICFLRENNVGSFARLTPALPWDP